MRAWLEQDPPRTWDELLLKVFFARLVPRAALLQHLEEFGEAQRQVLSEYEAIRPASRYGELTLRYGLVVMPRRLAWLDEAVHELKELSR